MDDPAKPRQLLTGYWIAVAAVLGSPYFADPGEGCGNLCKRRMYHDYAN